MRFEIPEIKMVRFETENVLTQASANISETQTYKAAQQAITDNVGSTTKVLEFNL